MRRRVRLGGGALGFDDEDRAVLGPADEVEDPAEAVEGFAVVGLASAWFAPAPAQARDPRWGPPTAALAFT
jgi:hypothetical protein